MAKNQIIQVNYKGTEVGKIGYDENTRKSTFQYHPDFLQATPVLNLFPYVIRKVKNAQVFSDFGQEQNHGLPPMIADSLPDSFGNIVFKEWLETQNKKMLNPLEQLTYVGNRGMGALEYRPEKKLPKDVRINFEEIAKVAGEVLDFKRTIHQKALNNEALFNIFRMGTSAGGARPKILVSKDKVTGELIPGDLEISDEYQHYIIKLAVDEDYSRTKIEYAYYKMATAVGIEMMPCVLFEEKHFGTERFDRQDGEKLHILTASGMTGWDFNKPDNSSYENLFSLCLDLGLPHKEIQQLFRRMIFNVVFGNTDDHLKNFSFIFNDLENNWALSPAYDLTFAANPLLNFTRISRACSIKGKRANITLSDILAVADQFSIRNPKEIIKEVESAIDQFDFWCKELEIPVVIEEHIREGFVQLA